jgi:hypothetical protein
MGSFPRKSFKGFTDAQTFSAEGGIERSHIFNKGDHFMTANGSN